MDGRGVLAPLRTVRARTTIFATLAAGTALVIAAVALLVTLQAQLEQGNDAAAKGRDRDVAALVQTGALPRSLPLTQDDTFVQVLDAGGSVVASTPIERSTPVVDDIPAGDAFELHVVDAEVDVGEIDEFRVWALRVPSAEGDVVVYAGYSTESIQEATTVVRRALLVGTPLLVAVLAAVIWLLTGRALRPVESIRSEVETISETDLGHRLRVPATSDEIERLATTMNTMLDRLEGSVTRQRKFVADASHELQSPLAALRTRLEVARTPDEEVSPEPAESLLDDVGRMEQLVKNLLFLARRDAVQPARPTQDVDLDDVVLEEVQRAQSQTRVPIETSTVSAAPVRGGREDLARLTRNLLDNAVRHARRQVRVALGVHGDHVVLRIDDDGPGIAEADRERVFDRFVKLDDSRTPAVSGSGLGLAIAREIAEQHSGTVTASTGALGGNQFVVTLPAQ
ncbi:MAG: sensor histidine kinase [Nocardioidaceae bacterium]